MSNKILRLPEWLRTELAGAKEEGETYSDTVLRILPEPSEETILEHPEDSMGRIRVDEEAHARAHALAGENVSAAQVMAYYYERNTLGLNVDAALRPMEEDYTVTVRPTEASEDGYLAAFTDNNHGIRVEGIGDDGVEAVANLSRRLTEARDRGDL